LRLLVRRVEAASVRVAGSVTGQINQGLLVYIGIEKMDQLADLEWGSKKSSVFEYLTIMRER
jgi:D-Tyr-tRNAtyr deacylase